MTRRGRIVALDLGERRVGVAISDEMQLTARPLGVVQSVGPRRDARAVRDLLGELEPCRLVVGLPLLASGDEGDSARNARTRGEDLARRLELPVTFVDESGTTIEAAKDLLDAGGSRARRRAQVDAQAAVRILLRHLAENGGANAPAPGALAAEGEDRFGGSSDR